MSEKNLPKSILIEFTDDNNIKVTADEHLFPFPISEFSIYFTPEEGASYAITAGSFKANPIVEKVIPPVKQAVSNFKPNKVMTPSALGLLGDDSMDVDMPMEGEEIDDLLNICNPDRKKLVVKDPPKGFAEYSMTRIESKSRMLPSPIDADAMELLVQDLAKAEKELFEEQKATGESLIEELIKLPMYSPPTKGVTYSFAHYYGPPPRISLPDIAARRFNILDRRPIGTPMTRVEQGIGKLMHYYGMRISLPYEDPYYFSRIFRQTLGLSPQHYRNEFS